MPSVGVIGCGAWATTIAKISCENGNPTTLWCHRQDYANSINNSQSSTALPAVLLPKSLIATTDPIRFRNVDTWIACVPSKFFNSIAAFQAAYTDQPILSLIKGFPRVSPLSTASACLHELFPNAPLAVMSGPNLAIELAHKKPAASVVASAQKDIAHQFQTILSNDYLRIYSNMYPLTVEWGGILKNIYAIGAGIVDGLQLGHNSKAAFITRALVEMARIIPSDPNSESTSTIYGLSGLGDLIATCSSTTSRNWQRGYHLATGSNHEILGTVEGERTAAFIVTTTPNPEEMTPICYAIWNILSNNADIKTTIQQLFERKLKSEI